MHFRTHIHIPTDVGVKAADIVAEAVGSWEFILIQSTC
jgi:uncharacterized membrane protein